jgi:hypothetical protein
MTIELPRPIADYFTADAANVADAVARCFTQTAVVTDERRIHRGREAIRAWKVSASAAYSYTVEPVSIASEDGRTVVTGRVEGDFPGSPVDLRYRFVLDGEEIAALEITGLETNP